MSRISSTLYEVGGNFARPTKFTAMVHFPPGLMPSLEPNQIDILCKAINAPSLQNIYQEIKVKGHTVRVPIRSEYTKEIALTFYIDEWFQVKKIFEEWLKSLDSRFFNEDECADDIPPEDKYGSITLIGQDYLETGVSPHPIQIDYSQVFPINISDMNFSSEDKDNVMELSVTFAYQNYEII
jgi:hypothetical protein